MRNWLVEAAKNGTTRRLYVLFGEHVCTAPWGVSTEQQAESWTAEHTRLFPSSCPSCPQPQTGLEVKVQSPLTTLSWDPAQHQQAARDLIPPALHPLLSKGIRGATPSVLGIGHPRCTWHRNFLLVMLRAVSDSLSRWKCTQHLKLAVSTQANMYRNQETRKLPADFFLLAQTDLRTRQKTRQKGDYVVS